MLPNLQTPDRFPAMIQHIAATREGREAMREVLQWERRHGLGEMDTIHGRHAVKVISSSKQVTTRAPRPRKEHEPIPCECCANLFTPFREGQRFCSDTCRTRTRERIKSAERRAKKQAAKATAPKAPAYPRTINCQRCNAETVANASRQRYCPTCSVEVKREIKREAKRQKSKKRKTTATEPRP